MLHHCLRKGPDALLKTLEHVVVHMFSNASLAAIDEEQNAKLQKLLILRQTKNNLLNAGFGKIALSSSNMKRMPQQFTGQILHSRSGSHQQHSTHLRKLPRPTSSFRQSRQPPDPATRATETSNRRSDCRGHSAVFQRTASRNSPGFLVSSTANLRTQCPAKLPD